MDSSGLSSCFPPTSLAGFPWWHVNQRQPGPNLCASASGRRDSVHGFWAC